MADRNVTVRLRAETAQYQAALAAAAAQTQAFGKQASGAGKEIDKYSGRLRAVADAALTLGPALVPISAAAIPALTAGLAGLGAAAGAIGVTVLAVKGLGDGLKAIDAYQLNPTVENLSKLRIEMEKLGPAGAEFAHFLDGLEEPLGNLQKVARAGLFPGVELGIEHLMSRLPQVRRVVFDLAQGMGELADEAGRNLAGSKFDAFFNYIETDARPTMEAFAHATGNVVEGVANLIVAFAPMSRDFTHSLEDATAAFAQWSRGLDTNKSFQDFLSYIRESGPEVAHLMGALGDAVVGLVKAAAPFGHVMLPALTGLAKAFAAIANSPIGGPLYTAAAALTIFNRGAQLTIGVGQKLGSAFDSLGTKAETTRGKLATLGAKGGVLLGTVVAVGALADSINRIDTQNLDRSLTALQFGDVTDTVSKVVDSIQQLNAPQNKVDLGKILSLDNTLFTSSMAKFADNVDQVDQSLAQMVETGQKAEAANIFQKITALAQAKGVDPAKTADAFDAYAQALANVSRETARASGATNPFQQGLGAIVGELRAAKNAASDLSGALSDLNGWLDKRQAVRDYRDSIHELSKALKDGFQPKDAETIDQVGRNIAQLASQIKDKSLRADFLAGARASLEDLANKSGPKAKAQVEKLIGALDRYGLTHATAKADVDNKPANSKINDTSARLRKYGGTVATAKANVDNSDAISGINQARTFLDRLNGQTATQYINVVTRRYNLPQPKADGGLISGPGGPRDDKIPALLSNREYVVKASAVDKYGVAMFDAINARRFADGGSAGGHNGRPGSFTLGTVVAGQLNPFGVFVQGAFNAAHALKSLKAALEQAQKSVEKEKQKRDDLISAEQSFMQSVGGAYAKADLFSGGLSNFDTALQANTNDTNSANAALAAAAAHGLNGPLYQALAASGNLTLLQEFAGLSSDQIQIREQQFAAQSNAQSALGTSAANAAGFTQAIKDQTHELHEAQRERKHLAGLVKDLEVEVKKMGDRVENGARKGVSERDKRTHARVRTGS